MKVVQSIESAREEHIGSHGIGARALDAALARHATTCFVAISKSGGTAETLMQTIAVLSALRDAGLQTRIPDIFLGITEPAIPRKANGLRDLLGKYHVPMLDHDPGVGGRYSAFTNVELLPAAMIGLDVAAVRAGAGLALGPVLTKKSAPQVPAAVGAALSVALAGEGQVDQRNDGLDSAKHGPRIDSELAKLASEAGFGGKTIGDLVAAEGRATAETLAGNGCPVRTIHLGRLDEEALGELMMHFMLETIIAAHLLGVDPFDQPAVEEGKVLAKKYLIDS
jgi:glucose-6-phosphate isomerase